MRIMHNALGCGCHTVGCAATVQRSTMSREGTRDSSTDGHLRGHQLNFAKPSYLAQRAVLTILGLQTEIHALSELACGCRRHASSWSTKR